MTTPTLTNACTPRRTRGASIPQAHFAAAHAGKTGTRLGSDLATIANEARFVDVRVLAAGTRRSGAAARFGRANLPSPTGLLHTEHPWQAVNPSIDWIALKLQPNYSTEACSNELPGLTT